MNDPVLLDRMLKTVPAERQLNWQEMGYYNFIHFGMNTLKNKEWGKGTAPASDFKLKHIDTDQWAKACKASGSKGIIFTAKHHDGFCLFPSKFTDYTVANSPYQDGKGDVVKQLSESCKKFDLKFGIYLSPWDRHEKTYGTDAYNDFFVNQLTELLTNYGEIFEVWLDGACGEGENGKKQVYDFERYYKVIRELRPNAVIAVCGPDVRWIGNEGGKTRESEWSVVPARLKAAEFVREQSQTEENNAPQRLTSATRDLGSRRVLKEEQDLIWYPAECDVSITPRKWFYHFFELCNLMPVSKLKKLYWNTVGNNACLLLNVAPDKKGVLPNPVVKRLSQFGDAVAKAFSAPVFTDEPEFHTEDDEYVYEISTPKESIARIVLKEDCKQSQRVEKFTIEAKIQEQYRVVFSGTTIGYRKFCEISPVVAGKWRVVVKKSRYAPRISDIQMYSDK